MSRARKKKEEMSGNSLGVLSSGGLAVAERSEGERSEPQRSGATAKVGADSVPASRPDSEVVAKPKRLTYWRRERAHGILGALTPQKRGPKSKRNPLDEENQKLRRQNARLTEDLRKAHIIIDVQKKVAALLGHPIPESDPDPEEKS